MTTMVSDESPPPSLRSRTPCLTKFSAPDLASGADLSASIEQAFSYDGLGILTVKNVPDLPELRRTLLPLARTFGDLPEDVKVLRFASMPRNRTMCASGCLICDPRDVLGARRSTSHQRLFMPSAGATDGRSSRASPTSPKAPSMRIRSTTAPWRTRSSSRPTPHSSTRTFGLRRTYPSSSPHSKPLVR